MGTPEYFVCSIGDAGDVLVPKRDMNHNPLGTLYAVMAEYGGYAANGLRALWWKEATRQCGETPNLLAIHDEMLRTVFDIAT
jgi:hypothetical protein